MMNAAAARAAPVEPADTNPSASPFETSRAATLMETPFGIEIAGRALDAGERIELRYGAGPRGARVDRYAERESRIWFAVDGDGDGVRGLLQDSPTIEILPASPARLVLTLPTTARPGDALPLRVAVLDAGEVWTSEGFGVEWLGAASAPAAAP